MTQRNSTVRPKKTLGQHFLESRPAIDKMVESAGVLPGDVVIEIGPGTGALTEALLGSGAHVIAVELDRRCIPTLNTRFEDAILDRHLIILEGDIRDPHIAHEIWDEILVEHMPYMVVANIPYYITGFLLRMFLEHERPPHTLTFLVQDEVATGIAKSHKESIASLSVKLYGEPAYGGHVSKTHFDPPPKVDSAILTVKHITKERAQEVGEAHFFHIIKAGFRSKRKMLINNLSDGLKQSREHLETIFRTVNLDPKVRAEDVALPTWLELTRALLPQEKKKHTP
jgi:16S rRNA (adenine1518-N6/adenine1519-N6)-dimethyltransferase